MTIQGILMLVVFLSVLTAFAFIVKHLYSLMRKGKPEARFDRWGERIKAVLIYVFGQARVLSQPAGLGHFLIFWGFIFITIGTAEHILSMIIPGFSLSVIVGQRIAEAIVFLQDIFGILVIGAIVVSLVRRFFFKPIRLKIDDPKAPREAVFILVLIFILILLMYGMRATTILMEPSRFSKVVAPVSYYVSGLVAEWNLNLPIASSLFAWLHHGIIFFFLLFIPFSKHVHILGAIPNVFFKNLGSMGTLSRMDFEDEDAEKFGISVIPDFTWKQILDLYACTECGRCQAACPAFLTDKPLSPFRLIHMLRGKLMSERKQILNETETPPIVPETITEDELWSCTTCGACMQECPPFIEHVQKIVDMRRYLVLTESRFPSELQQVFRNMEVNYNPWAIAYTSRADWTEGLDVPLASEKKKIDVLYWVGCAGSFDSRGQKIARAMVRILNSAGVDYAILGVEEHCCGETARRLGNEYLAQMLIESNIETLSKYEFNRILVTCPHGFNSFRVEYPQFGFDKPVVHHSEFLLELVRSGRLQIKDKLDISGAYHDSCYLSRYNSVIDQPRELVKSAVRDGLKEFSRKGKRSFCCGAGGGRMWMEENLGTRINEERTREFLELGVEHIFTACPFCMTMFEDGLKAYEREEEVKVLDLAEVMEMSAGLAE